MGEQKQQESARLYSEEKYRLLVETASDAIVSIDDKGMIVFANPAIATVFGYEPTEVMGKGGRYGHVLTEANERKYAFLKPM